jgi:hypothetical protein
MIIPAAMSGCKCSGLWSLWSRATQFPTCDSRADPLMPFLACRSAIASSRRLFSVSGFGLQCDCTYIQLRQAAQKVCVLSCCRKCSCFGHLHIVDIFMQESSHDTALESWPRVQANLKAIEEYSYST